MILAMTIPDDPAALPGWLDRQLAGPDLGRVVAEMLAVRGPDAGEPVASITNLFGDRLPAVCRDGLRAATPGSVRWLLRQPHLLLDLQEHVLLSGSAYWDRLAVGPDVDELVDSGLSKVRQVWAGSPVPAGGSRPLAQPARRAPAPSVAWYRQPWAVCLATAAAVLVAVFAPRLLNPPAVEVAAVTWGWAKPGAIPADGPPAAYLTALANSADQWFDQKPDDAAGLARRINELRTGCSQLIFSPHKPLTDDDRKWLVERCQTWAKAFDKNLESLEAGEPPAAVRATMDQTVRQLTQALRQRASTVAG